MRQSTPCYVNTDWFEESVMSNTGRLKATLRYTQRTMQRGIATVLALLFSFLLILPAFTSSNLTVPLCCRKDGKHHCMLQSGGRANSGPGVTAMAAKCPYCPHSTVASHAQFETPLTSVAVFASWFAHPAGLAQTEASYRVSYDRARQKRGPPFSVLS